MLASLCQLKLMGSLIFISNQSNLYFINLLQAFQKKSLLFNNRADMYNNDNNNINIKNNNNNNNDDVINFNINNNTLAGNQLIQNINTSLSPSPLTSQQAGNSLMIIILMKIIQ
ncbi:hypothetical protein HELRODRAFT_177637 [Helobdella robusta]|uniref:Uncharacterized protein n=1 Tax=Helobdella robusta TaxID=6412 RepID=T1FBZ5_HELRO|nr:hypothetical protein HELRODRAFT_177637 [Helobdella robusta]ESN97966.1 hypothetical protein HELRODRAFT_177637 [Helobdella robusta]